MHGLTEPLEVWAGPECSFLKVGDWLCDQLSLTGHDVRDDDIDRMAALGVRGARYPVLWGRSRRSRDATDWAWAEDRLEQLDGHGIEPVVGLLHHGFGPRGADPLDPTWPAAFGRYAGEVARRFPGLRSFLPINEPLTTARFGGLYGWWPPYGRDEETFAALLVAQALGYLEAARAIRAVRPDARIVVNEDGGRAWGTAACRPAVARHNMQRWLAFDLLAGRVDRSHPLRNWLGRTPALRRGLDLLAAEPELPDLLGIDYYVTSDRFLDHETERYQGWSPGGGDRSPFVDVELCRVSGYEIAGFDSVLRETWRRYEIPVALTEVHLAGDPDDQAAWWQEAWKAARSVRAEGIPVAAVTAWATFGAFEWDTCLRERRGVYASGCFDVRSGEPIATPTATSVARSARGLHDPSRAGWWRRRDRFGYRLPDRLAV